MLVARREDRLQSIHDELVIVHPDIDIRIIACDVSKEYECLALMEEIKDLPVYIFINNAGFGDCGDFVKTDLKKDLSMIDVNVRAVHLLTKLVLKRFVKQDKGYLLNVASSAGLIPGGPYMATYYATKAYVTSLTRAVAQELKDRKSKVYVGALCPGPVDTEFNSVANVEFALKGISVETCVQAAIDGMTHRKTIIVPTAKMQIAMALGTSSATKPLREDSRTSAEEEVSTEVILLDISSRDAEFGLKNISNRS